MFSVGPQTLAILAKDEGEAKEILGDRFGEFISPTQYQYPNEPAISAYCGLIAAYLVTHSTNKYSCIGVFYSVRYKRWMIGLGAKYFLYVDDPKPYMEWMSRYGGYDHPNHCDIDSREEVWGDIMDSPSWLIDGNVIRY